MKRCVLFLLAVLALAVISPACGPTPAPEVIVRTAVVETVVVETTVVEVTAAPEGPESTQELVVFWTWASTGFEAEAVEKMVETFSASTGIQIELVIK
jgi:ABC-type glycerol-3-phosphate transport system substrate-binding protein